METPYAGTFWFWRGSLCIAMRLFVQMKIRWAHITLFIANGTGGRSHPKWSAQHRLQQRNGRKIYKAIHGGTSIRSAMMLDQFFKANYFCSHRRIGGTLSRFNSKKSVKMPLPRIQAVFLIRLVEACRWQTHTMDIAADDWTTGSENITRSLNGDILVWNDVLGSAESCLQ